MIRLFIFSLLSLLAGPFFVTAQQLADNNAAPSPRRTVGAPSAGPSAPSPSDNRRPSELGARPTSALSSNTTARKLPAPGWNKQDDQVTGSINRELLTRLKIINNQLIGFLYDSCLDGPAHHGSWHGEFRSDKSDSSGLKFGIKCSFPASTLEITAGSLSPLMRPVTVYGHEYNALTPTKTTRNGCPYFEPPYLAEGAMMVAIKAGEKNAPQINTWLVTANPDELPYTPMSRKEFLEAMGSSLKANKDALIGTIKEKNHVRSQSDQEADKQKALESLGATYSGAELEMRRRNYLDHYKSDEEDLKEIIDAQTAPLDSTIAFIDGMLHRLAPATLAAPAYVPAKAGEFEGFADGEEDAVMLIHLMEEVAGATDPKGAGRGVRNLNQRATPDKPRFFLLSWTYDPADPEAVIIKDLLNKKLDPGYMRELLKK